jgi:hypothetical protein
VTFDVRSPRGALAEPSTAEVAAVLVALATLMAPPLPAPAARSRWREAARNFDDDPPRTTTPFRSR